MKQIYKHLISILLLISTILLASCSSHVQHDGPPNFYVDETKVPDAVPKPEKLSKYGNMHSYVVNGIRYYPMKSASNYDVVGTASWYGTRFDTHKTSDGERYNLLAMTAAHKTLPLPTYVEVTNLQNHRKIIVKVNDRGPFKPNRIIDLSYVAAKKLGMLAHGTATVRVRAIDPYQFQYQLQLAKNNHTTFHPFESRPQVAQNNPPASPFFHYANTKRSAYQPLHHFAETQSRPLFKPNRTPTPVDDFVYLQVGAFKNYAYAQRLKTHLTSIVSEPVNIIHPTGKSNLYRVKIGPLRTMTAVNKVTHRLKNLGIKANKLYG